jgi:hypothetical protein
VRPTLSVEESRAEGEDSKQHSLLKRALASLTLVLVGILFALVLAEIAVRMTGVTNPRFHFYDPVYGWILHPNFSDWYTREGHAYVEINSQGFRDREWSQEKPPRVLRVAVLGDSYTSALQVGVEERFSAILAKDLASCQALQGRPLEVLNFGVDGWGTGQQLLLLRNQVFDYRPDIVVLAFLTENDISNNVRASGGASSPLYVLQDDRLVLDTSFSASIPATSLLERAYWAVYDQSRLLQLLNRVEWPEQLGEFQTDLSQAFEEDESENADNEDDQREQPAGGDKLRVHVYRAPRPNANAAGWGITERLLVTMHKDVVARGAQFLLVTLSNGPQVYPDPAARQVSMKRLGVPDLFYADTRVRTLAEHNGIPVLSLAPVLQQYADEHKAFLHGFPPHLGEGHWNQVGHRVAGETIAQKLCTDILPATGR